MLASVVSGNSRLTRRTPKAMDDAIGDEQLRYQRDGAGHRRQTAKETRQRRLRCKRLGINTVDTVTEDVKGNDHEEQGKRGSAQQFRVNGIADALFDVQNAILQQIPRSCVCAEMDRRAVTPVPENDRHDPGHEQQTPDHHQVLGADDRGEQGKQHSTGYGAHLGARVDQWREPLGLQGVHILVHIEGGMNQQQFGRHFVDQVIGRID